MRRLEELRRRGEGVEFDRVLADILRRDARDGGRKDAPMRASDDAMVLDTTRLFPDECFAAALAHAEAAKFGMPTVG
jgi:cytidylate kinase